MRTTALYIRNKDSRTKIEIITDNIDLICDSIDVTILSYGIKDNIALKYGK